MGFYSLCNHEAIEFDMNLVFSRPWLHLLRNKCNLSRRTVHVSKGGLAAQTVLRNAPHLRKN